MHHPANAGPVQAVPPQRLSIGLVPAGSRCGALRRAEPNLLPPCYRGSFPTKARGAKTMNWDRVEGNWKQFKGKAQQQWGKLTDDDLDVIEGKRTELSGKLQARYGYAKDEAEKNIDTWLNSIH
jgi:uncharacterized protein YjbJ (UPF0337 family)